MLADGRRKKKLKVAFQFQFSNQAGWRCDQCRAQGLEIKRRCGWKPGTQEGPRRVVWARGRAATEECPKSYIRPESLAWIEWWRAWRSLGMGGDTGEMEARRVDALMLLEEEARIAAQEGGR